MKITCKVLSVQTYPNAPSAKHGMIRTDVPLYACSPIKCHVLIKQAGVIMCVYLRKQNSFQFELLRLTLEQEDQLFTILSSERYQMDFSL